MFWGEGMNTPAFKRGIYGMEYNFLKLVILFIIYVLDF